MEKHCSDQNDERFCTIAIHQVQGVTLAALDKGEKGQMPVAKSFLCLRYCAVHPDRKLWGAGFIPTLGMEKVEGPTKVIHPERGVFRISRTLWPRGYFSKPFARQPMATNPNISKCINTQNDMIRGRSLNRSQASLKIALSAWTLPLYLWTSAYLGLKKIHQIPPSPPSILKRDNWEVSRTNSTGQSYRFHPER